MYCSLNCVVDVVDVTVKTATNRKNDITSESIHYVALRVGI